MKIDQAALPNIILAVAGFVTAVGGFALQAWMTIRQTRQLKEHSDANVSKIADKVMEATGTHKVLPPGA